jgi:superfamily I DNA and/or RNA helicase
VNTSEARIAVRIARGLNDYFAKAGKMQSVLVLAPYAAQVRELSRRVDQLGELSHIRVEVATVDAVQGREADYVIFTVTRSNDRRAAGFLKLEARANVALSRARFGLTVIGDLAFCRATDTPFRDVAQYVTSHPDSCTVVAVPT